MQLCLRTYVTFCNGEKNLWSQNCSTEKCSSVHFATFSFLSLKIKDIIFRLPLTRDDKFQTRTFIFRTTIQYSPVKVNNTRLTYYSGSEELRCQNRVWLRIVYNVFRYSLSRNVGSGTSGSSFPSSTVISRVTPSSVWPSLTAAVPISVQI